MAKKIVKKTTRRRAVKTETAVPGPEETKMKKAWNKTKTAAVVTGKAAVKTGGFMKKAGETIPVIFDWLLNKLTAPLLLSVISFLTESLKQTGKLLSVAVILFTAYMIGYTYFEAVAANPEAPDRFIKAFSSIENALSVLQGTVVGAISLGLVFKKQTGGIVDKIKTWASDKK